MSDFGFQQIFQLSSIVQYLPTDLSEIRSENFSGIAKPDGMVQKITSRTNMTYDGGIKTILTTGLLAGTLDAIGAILVYGADPLKLFQYIAAGAFGLESAFSGGIAMTAWGLLFHYIIALAWTAIFFYMYPAVGVLRKNKYLTGLLYGIFIWVVMNQIILPFSRIPQSPFNLKAAVVGASILMLLVGLPISLLIDRFYKQHPQSSAL